MPSVERMLRCFSAVVVTGGSSGLGKSFIEHIAKVHPGIRVCNLSRREPVMFLSQLNLRHFPCDLENSSAIEAAARAVLNHPATTAPTGRVLLINNSGFGSYGHFSECALPQQLGIVDVNMRAPIHLTGLLLPMLLQRGGTVMNVASAAAFQPTAFMATYGASKAFLLHWSLALNEELRGSGVNTLAVCPGPTATGFSKRAGVHFGGVPESLSMTCDEVVQTSLRALAAGRTQTVTGWMNRLLTTFSSLTPKPLAARLAAKALAGYARKTPKTE